MSRGGRRLSYSSSDEFDTPQPSKKQKTVHDGSDEALRESIYDASGEPAIWPYTDIPQSWSSARQSRSQTWSSNAGLEEQSRRDCYTIAWICALSVEMAAARAMLDEVHETLITDQNDNNTYVLGSIGFHHVVLACLPQYGMNNAATVLTNLIRSFPSVRLGLIVGIGGGAPTMADIRLGDIVVGTRVMQYDLGRIVENGTIQWTAIPKIPHPRFGAAVATLRAEHELGFSNIPSILGKKLGGCPGYGRPNLPDDLFVASYQHATSTLGCDGCEKSTAGISNIVPRRQRLSQSPVVHYGVIASSNQVMRSGITRDKIARQLDAMCFEMEAAGLMDILPCLPIRGICDYSDSHKNKDWQKYAAATAAAYATELLGILPAAGASNTAPDVPNSIGPAPCSRDTHSGQGPLSDRRSQLLESLRYEQIDTRKLTIKAALAKTCVWFLKNQDYQAWIDPKRLAETRGFLWIRGKPGAGKSTIMKFLYTQAKRKSHSRGELVASFFFNARGEQLEKSIPGMYRSLLLQLLEGYPDLQKVLDDPDLIPRNQIGCPPLNVLRDLFANAVSRLGQRLFTCFIDALDECDEQQVRTMVQDLEDLADQSVEVNIPLRVCFSSRHYPYINIRHGIQLTLENQPGHMEDLANYVGNRLNIKDTAMMEDLREQILTKAAGVFLWVVLVVDILNEENERGRLAVRKRLAELPSDLSELFKDMLGRDKKNMEDLLLCILWILYAKRPLTPQEYYHALWAGLSLKDLVDDEIPNITGSDATDVITSSVINSSKGLAEITKSKKPTVQFIHESVRDFLIKDKGLHELWPDLGFDWEIPGNDQLKDCCTKYLNHASVQHFMTLPITPGLREVMSQKYPFLEYASQNVLLHADSAAVAISQTKFLSEFELCLPHWTQVVNVFEKHRIRKYNPGIELLYVLAERGTANLILFEPNRKSFFNIGHGRYGPPLFAALAVGHHDVVKTFLKIQTQNEPANSPLHDLYKQYCEDKRNRVTLGRGFSFSRKESVFRKLLEVNNEALLMFLYHSGHLNIDHQEFKNIHHNQTSLEYASQSGQESVVRLLLNKGTGDKVEKKVNIQRAFLEAVRSGHMAVVELLLARGANIEEADSQESLLCHAIPKCDVYLFEFLLDKGAKVDRVNKDGEPPLHFAARLNRVSIVEFLLDKWAKIDEVAGNGETPLHFAAQAGCVSTAEFLLDRGAKVDGTNKDGETPLHLAARSSGPHSVILEKLLDRGAKVDGTNKDGETPLHLAARSSGSYSLNITETLLSRGAKVDGTNKDGETPLHLAARSSGPYSNNTAIALLNRGAKIDGTNKDGETPLHLAARSSGPYNNNTAIALLNRGAKIDGTNKDGKTPLHLAARSSGPFSDNIAGVLLNRGAKINGTNKDGETPLHLAARLNGPYNNNIAGVLLNRGAKIDGTNKDGETPLHLAARLSGPYNNNIAGALLSRGAKIDGTNKDGETPLHLAARSSGLFSDDIAIALLDRGAKVDGTNKDGETPLQLATRLHRIEIVKMLLSRGASPGAIESGDTPLALWQNWITEQ
ncbi:hypothetical protein TWF730_011187 [Orbilia blumenaviensis]|uniref:protein S-acyltransferase n=1 Tax=Orbilia blumenaviensis TaxID=1796055 RepID=A0AAV9UKE4_9PEZI